MMILNNEYDIFLGFYVREVWKNVFKIDLFKSERLYLT